MFEKLDNCKLCRSCNIQIVDEVASVWRCRNCGYYFDNPRPTTEEIDCYYSRPVQYEEWLTVVEERNELWQRRLRKILRYAKSGSLLDVGAGIGQFLVLARSHFSEVAGTEVSSQAVELAASRFLIDLIKGRVESIDFGKRTFDNITLFHVLEHVHEPQLLLDRCRDLLNPGGMLFVAVPNEIRSLPLQLRRCLINLGLKWNRRRGILGLEKIVLDGSLQEIHLSHFTEESLVSALKRSGFAIIDRDLDQYYVASGYQAAKEHLYFAFCSAIFKFTRQNVYETIWLVAQKQ